MADGNGATPPEAVAISSEIVVELGDLGEFHARLNYRAIKRLERDPGFRLTLLVDQFSAGAWGVTTLARILEAAILEGDPRPASQLPDEEVIGEIMVATGVDLFRDPVGGMVLAAFSSSATGDVEHVPANAAESEVPLAPGDPTPASGTSES